MDVETCLLSDVEQWACTKMSLSKGRGVITVSGRKYYNGVPLDLVQMTTFWGVSDSNNSERKVIMSSA